MVASTTDLTTKFSYTSGALQPHKKERTVQTVLSFLWSWRRKEPPVAVPPASEAKSRGAEHSQLLPSSHASDSLQLIKKDRHSAVFLCGAGGSRTLVQTSDRCAFYMLIP